MWSRAEGARGGPAACTHSRAVPGGSGRQSTGLKPPAWLPGPGLRSRRRSLRGPPPGPAGPCSWPWRGGSRPEEAGHWGAAGMEVKSLEALS